jgi:hypothetical protein
MSDRPDITIPEEALRAADHPHWTTRAKLEAAAPLIVAAALSEMADQLDVRGVDDASAHLRARAAELRDGAK